MTERYISPSDAAEQLAALIVSTEGDRMPSSKMWAAMNDAFQTGALTFYDEYRQPIDLEMLRRTKWEFLSLYDRDDNHLGLYGETTTPAAINAWLEVAGSPHRFPIAIGDKEPKAAPVVAVSGSDAPERGHRDLMVPVIEVAQRECTNPFDPPAVWAVLVCMADTPISPLLGRSDDGIKWQDANDETQFFALKNLRDRLKRMQTKALKRAKTRLSAE